MVNKRKVYKRKPPIHINLSELKDIPEETGLEAKLEENQNGRKRRINNKRTKRTGT